MPTKAPTYRVQPPAAKVDRRPSASSRGYDADWQRFRRWYAASNPAICADCGHAGASKEMHLDHKRALRDGGTRLDPDNVQWLCLGCHNRKTAKEKTAFTAK